MRRRRNLFGGKHYDALGDTNGPTAAPGDSAHEGARPPESDAKSAARPKGESAGDPETLIEHEAAMDKYGPGREGATGIGKGDSPRDRGSPPKEVLPARLG